MKAVDQRKRRLVSFIRQIWDEGGPARLTSALPLCGVRHQFGCDGSFRPNHGHQEANGRCPKADVRSLRAARQQLGR